MKKISCAAIFFFIILFADAQIRKIPAQVTDAFAIRYPHASGVEWKDKLQYFEATFQLNGATITADFSSKGEWESSERILSFEQLPSDVKDGISKSKYADWEKRSVTEIQELGKPLQYKINVYKSGFQKKNLFFNADGKLLKDPINL